MATPRILAPVAAPPARTLLQTSRTATGIICLWRRLRHPLVFPQQFDAIPNNWSWKSSISTTFASISTSKRGDFEIKKTVSIKVGEMGRRISLPRCCGLGSSSFEEATAPVSSDATKPLSVYLLKSAVLGCNSTYCGSTRSLSVRLQQHNGLRKVGY